MLKLDASEYGTNRTTALLDRIATALDCPVAALSEPSLCDPSQTAELLRLWLMLAQEQDRLKVLSFINALALEANVPQNR